MTSPATTSCPAAPPAWPRGGLRAADTIAAAARDADLVAVMVATPEQLEQVLSSLMAPPGPGRAGRPDGPDGAPALAPGTIVMITATVGPEAVAAAAGRLAGQAVVDAPVSGGVARAAAGDLLIMVSGPADAVRRDSGRSLTRWPGTRRSSAPPPATASG